MHIHMIAVVIAVLRTGATLWRLIAGDIRDMRRDVGDLRERMASLEGLVDGLRSAIVRHSSQSIRQ